MHWPALVTALLLVVSATPAQAATYDFTWEARDTHSSSTLPSIVSGQGTATVEPGPRIGGTPTTILRFTGPDSGPFDGQWGGGLVLYGDSYNGSVTYPSALNKGGLAALGYLTFTDTGFTVSGTHRPSGPDRILGVFRGVGTTRTVATPEPASLLALAVVGFAAAIVFKRRGTRRDE